MFYLVGLGLRDEKVRRAGKGDEGDVEEGREAGFCGLQRY